MNQISAYNKQLIFSVEWTKFLRGGPIFCLVSTANILIFSVRSNNLYFSPSESSFSPVPTAQIFRPVDQVLGHSWTDLELFNLIVKKI